MATSVSPSLPAWGAPRAQPYGTCKQRCCTPWTRDLKLWAQKWRWYERNSLPWNRARIHFEFARRAAFCRWPVHGNVLEMLREGRLELGPHVLLEPDVWLTAPAPGRIRIGGGTFLNLGVQVAAVELRRDRRALHVRQRLLRHRRQPPLRRPGAPGAVAGLHVQGPDAASATTSGAAPTSSSPAA